MWAGGQVSACFVTARSYWGILRHKWTQRSSYHPFGGKTKLGKSFKRALCTAIRNSEASQARGCVVIKGCLRHGTHMGDVLVSTHKTCISKTRVPALKAWLACLFAAKGLPCVATGLLWNEICAFKRRPVALEMLTLFSPLILQAWAFVGLVYNMGKCKINPALTSLVLCARRRKLEPGLTICTVIKERLSPTLIHCVCLSVFVLLNFASPATAVFGQSFLHSQHSALNCSLV